MSVWHPAAPAWSGVGALKIIRDPIFLVNVVLAFGSVVGVIRSEGMRAPALAKLISSAGSDTANAKSELVATRCWAPDQILSVSAAPLPDFETSAYWRRFIG